MKISSRRGLIYFISLILVSVSLSGCPSLSDEEPLDQAVITDRTDASMAGAVEGGEGEVAPDMGDQCAELDQCADPKCADALICQSCESGGSCLYTGVLRIFGQALSRNGQVVSDLSVRAVCGDDEVEVSPGDQGRYELTLEVSQCDHLVPIAERAANTEGYVPVVRRLQMPPPVNTIEMNFRLIPGEEIRCDGVTCASMRAYSSFDTGEFYVGYAHSSGELNELDNFGAIFESTEGELLWLHRFSYFDFRDDQSRALYNIFFGGGTNRYALSRLNFNTRAWVADLASGITTTDYHTSAYSVYFNNEERWNEQRDLLTDPAIDPDQDGEYETIEMNAYRLNFELAQWEVLRDSRGEQLYSKIVAEVESAYDSISNRGIMERIVNALYSINRIYVFVPDVYLRGVQTTGMYGPGHDEGQAIGQYRSDYTAIPTTGSGVFAIGQPIPKACWALRVLDACERPIMGAEIEVRGVNHGYFTQTITNEDGLGCVEVGRSETMGLDFDGDHLSNELFDVELKALRVLGQPSISPPMNRVESTPVNEGSCRDRRTCSELTLNYTRCQETAPR